MEFKCDILLFFHLYLIHLHCDFTKLTEIPDANKIRIIKLFLNDKEDITK